MEKISGIFAPLSTPFDADGAVDDRAFEENVEKYGRTGLAGLVVLGSNGEFALLDEEEKVSLVARARRRLPEEKKIIAGTGRESLRDTLILTRRCADAGADAALVITPNYYKTDMGEAALERYYTETADASPLPVILYNMPRNTGVNISSALAVRLSAHPNIVGIKDSSANIVQITETIAGADRNFSVIAGSASFLLATLVLGGDGGTMAVANVVPDLCVELYEAFLAGNLSRAREIQFALMEINGAVTSRFGLGGMKAAMDMVGYRGGLPRRPILPASEETKAAIREIYRRLEIAPLV